MKNHRSIHLSVIFLLATLLSLMAAQPQALSQSLPKRLLVTQAIDEGARVTLAGNTHPEANKENDRGPVAGDFPMEHMMLLLRRPPELEKSLEKFIDRLHDQKSPIFHQWINAQEFGDKYGLAQPDLDTLSRWLESHGFKVNMVYRNGLVIDFSGTASQVQEAFHTEIHRLEVKGEKHYANMSDPQIPAALAPAVAGVVSLHDFRPQPVNPLRKKANYTVAGLPARMVVPADLATIYNLNPLFSLGLTGQGQTIVVVESTDAYSDADWQSFRSAFGLSGYTSASLTTIHPASTGTNNCTDPGAVPGVAEGEAALDVEWASAAAPGAAIVLASCSEGTATYGWFIALQNLLNAPGTPPAVISMSYGVAETTLGASANAAIYSTYQQAVAAGVSIFVSTGDAAAVNNDRGNPWAVDGINMNGFATTPYNVAVGGTDFSDLAHGTLSTYWSATNGPTWGSALSYVPEMTWNDSCGSTVLAAYFSYTTTYGEFGFCNSDLALVGGLNTGGGAGGPSGCAGGAPSTPGVVGGTCVGYAKPSWQSVVGNPSDGVRDIPDVSLFASDGSQWGHAYVFCMSDVINGGSLCTGAPDTWSGSGGTSFATPIMAGIQALANQATGARWGNPNPMYYYLARSEYGTSGNSNCNASLGNTVGSGCTFYDITLGTNNVPCEGTVNCYTPSGTIGVLSTSNSAYEPAFGTNVGWDFSTGIGSVNAYNLVAGIYNNTYFQLAVTTAGSGSGSVSSSPPGITCPGTCSNYFKIASKVTLTATAASGSTLAGWSGACTGTGTCTVTLNANLKVTATFNLPVGNPAVSLSAGSLTFAGQVIDTTSASKSVTVTNTGKGPLTLNWLGVSGNFGGTDNCPVAPSTLAPNASCTIHPNFTPTVSGTIPGELTISDNAPGAPHLINLTGTGLTAISISPSTLAFGTVTAGTTSAAKTVTVTNNLTTALTTSFVASGDYTAVGNGTNPCRSTLAAGAKCTMNVTFSPKSNGAIDGAVTITYNSSLSPQNVQLSGTGSGAAASPLSFSPTTMAFTELIGTTSASKTLTVTNTSAAAVDISSISASGNFKAVGGSTTPCAGSLAAGAKCTIAVTFSPSISGVVNGAVVIADGTSASPQIYDVTGTGVPPLTASAGSLTFAAQAVGTTSGAQTITLTNHLSTTLNTIIAASGQYAVAATGTSPCGSTLAAGAKCTFNVTFTPAVSGTIDGVVTVGYGETPGPLEVRLTGTGQ
ncbi:putative Peptidase S53 propeptide [Candidatus Sulfotelmatobacter kueseliae]|uniref:Putative Peptidase S53 propeptide n=1 Tax=Candidatus Sulfotelmatobacter kueseliae TaxID=2042962 RepID=A0A2U3KYX8_9BACT|nr:putative Peptidase S53 propeptide [Candidatus Sulfotelmatobacter kueseliae]